MEHIDPASSATCSSTDAPLRRSRGGAAFIHDLLEHADRGTALARPLTAVRTCPSLLARTPDVIQDPSPQRPIRSDSRTDVLVVSTISVVRPVPSSCCCRLCRLVSSLRVSISSDRDTAAKPPGHAQARSSRVLVATDEHEPGLDANAKYPDTAVRSHLCHRTRRSAVQVEGRTRSACYLKRSV
jgi:hypothetical protein